MIKIDLRDIQQYTTKCHICGSELLVDNDNLKRCSDSECLFRLLNNRIPFKAKKPKVGGGKCCGG